MAFLVFLSEVMYSKICMFSLLVLFALLIAEGVGLYHTIC